MKNFNKDYKLKITSLIVAATFLLNSTVYGMDLPVKAHLRVPVGQKNTLERMYKVMHKETGGTKKRKSSVQKAMGLSASDNRAIDSVEILEVDINKATERDINKLKADYEFLSPEHPIRMHVDALVKKLFPQETSSDIPTFKILASAGAGVNSWVYPNGTIIITPELIDFVESDEELVFVLLHEIVHFDREHFQETENVSKRASIRQSLGLDRYHEYEADMAAFYIMSLVSKL